MYILHRCCSTDAKLDNTIEATTLQADHRPDSSFTSSWPSWPSWLAQQPSWHDASWLPSCASPLAFMAGAAAFIARRFMAAFFLIAFIAFMAAGAAAFMARRFITAFFLIAFMAFMAAIAFMAFFFFITLPC